VTEIVPKPGRRDNWLNARVTEFLRQNPGNPFPAGDVELVAHVQEQIEIFAKSLLRDLYERLGKQVEQESWLKMLRYFSSFEGRNNCKFTTWLFLIVRSTKSEIKRSEGREPSASRRSVAADDEKFSAEIERALLAQVQVDFTEDVYATRLRDELLAFIVDPRHAGVMRLSLQGRTNQEIAQQTGMPEGTVSSILCRTRTLCRQTLTRSAQLSERSDRKAKSAAGR
jgi:RNA polymerase sigma factor (sigma-70 family)